jgi:hypothetical protein
MKIIHEMSGNGCYAAEFAHIIVTVTYCPQISPPQLYVRVGRVVR